MARVSEEKPQAAPATEYQDMRATKYGDQYTINLYNGMQGLAAEGSLFVATSATPGTGAAATAATGTTYSATQALLILYNSDIQPSYAAGRRIFLDTITLVCTAAGTASTSCHVAHQVDVGNRYSSGTNLLGTPVNVNMDASGVGSVGRAYGGVLTGTAATPARRTSRPGFPRPGVSGRPRVRPRTCSRLQCPRGDRGMSRWRIPPRCGTGFPGRIFQRSGAG